jgi:predicted lipoprotein with Yx(FWY)xxD motif
MKTKALAALAAAATTALVPLSAPARSAIASAQGIPQTGTVVAAISTAAYGSVLIGGGKPGTAPLANYPFYAISSDAGGKFGCTTARKNGFDLVAGEFQSETCTGPESDELNSVSSDDWPAVTTNGPPIAGPGVNQKLLGTVERPGIGDQVTYAGHPLYLYDTPSAPFNPEGEGWLETVYPLPPWHGLWDLVSARNGLPAPGQATIETETLPDGKSAVAAGEFPNFSSVAVSVYSFSRDHAGHSACTGACAATWIPVLTTGTPTVTGGIAPKDVGFIRRPDGTDQVTYEGKPLYLYSGEKVILSPGGAGPQSTGTVGNGNGLAGPGGGAFSLVSPLA